jgi:hypothetical protein
VNTVLSTRVDEHNYNHPPSPHDPGTTRHHVTVFDRAALHLGLALITWSRRTLVVAAQPSREQLCARYDHVVQRAQRESDAERALRLTSPTR